MPLTLFYERLSLLFYHVIVPCLTLSYFSSYCQTRDTGHDSGVVTDAGPGDTISRLSVSTVSASVSLDNLYLGEEADNSSDQSNRWGQENSPAHETIIVRPSSHLFSKQSSFYVILITVVTFLLPPPNFSLYQLLPSTNDWWNSFRTIEALTITEYEGSPRRYGPRKSGSKSSRSQRQHQRGKVWTQDSIVRVGNQCCSEKCNSIKYILLQIAPTGDFCTNL